MVPGFPEASRSSCRCRSSYDLQIASTRSFSSLDAVRSAAPLFSGTISARPTGGLRVPAGAVEQGDHVRLAGDPWPELDSHFPATTWITMRPPDAWTGWALQEPHALTTWDATVLALLARAAMRTRDIPDRIDLPTWSSPAGRRPILS